MSPAIRIENLSKRYIVSHEGKPNGYKTLRESLVDMASAPIRRLRGKAQATTEEFWALKDIDIDIQPGEVVGIIGRNGAGKSTLLKILSRITKPTKGSVTLNGRIGSLLEVGTGFHPELSGRENIYLNGSILGMSRVEIQSKFDEVVDFAGIARFLDTPVKRYSSGMYVRLAFSVAAHLEPEILIVDEVLAVGDAEFQKKCISKMKDVATAGRTVLFVSHNLASLEALCDRGIELQRGTVVNSGNMADVLSKYRSQIVMNTKTNNGSPFQTLKYLKNACLVDQGRKTTEQVLLGQSLCLQIAIEAHEQLRSPKIGVGFDDASGQRMLTVHTPLSESAIGSIRGSCDIICCIPEFPLAPGEYTMKIAITESGEELEAVDSVVPFVVIDGNAFNEGRGFHRGVCVAKSKWSAFNS